MEDFTVLYEKTLDEVKEKYRGDLMVFNHYPIRHMNQIFDKDDVKYIIVIQDMGIMLVVTKNNFRDKLLKF